MTQMLRLRNRQSVAWASVPVLEVEQWRLAIRTRLGAGERIAALFGVPDGADRVRLVVLLADDESGQLGLSSAVVGRRYAALTAVCPEASRFERELAEQCGVVPEGHPGLAPLRRHPPDHLPADWTPASLDREAYPFAEPLGADVHEVAVGPVHAGIIEPGHFRFQAWGEEVLRLDIMLGYQHRGIERLLERHGRDRAVLVAESIAGDSVIAHGSAFCGAMEALSRTRKSPRAQAIRGLALELERLANHLGDLGALAGDIAFQPAASYLGRWRGECLNLLMTLSGSRYGRGLVRPGGVAFDIDGPMAEELRGRVDVLGAAVLPVLDALFADASVQARFEGVGVVTHDACARFGLVGPPARACDVPRDVRHDHPYGIYRFVHIPVSTAFAGDVLARALVRRLEVQRSLAFVAEQLASLPKGAPRVALNELRPDELAVAMEEGWRGEVVHIALTDDRGSIRRHKVVDPSFHNWAALAEAMAGNQMSDFPMCNKSFNLSYAGHDL